MDAKAIVTWIIIGLIAGWLASLIVGGGGLVRYLITGLIGAFVGGFLANRFNIRLNLGNAFLEQIIISAVGAIVVVLLARLIA